MSTKRTDGIKSALDAYYWSAQKPTGGHVVVHMTAREEVAPDAAVLAVAEGKGIRLSLEELGLLAKRLSAATNPIEAGRVKQRLTCGFYGI